MKQLSHGDLKRIRARLRTLYGEQADGLMERFYQLVGRYGVNAKPVRSPVQRWDQRDCLLITYADSILPNNGETPLNALRQFADERLKGAVSTVHLLPFYPWSSDDGFSVIDYRTVAPQYGNWQDIHALGQSFRLAFDLVLNHCSSRSSWFRDFCTGIAPGKHYFLSMDPQTDLSAVFRPRTSPLLTPTRTRDGEAHVWTTFSADQIDLNWQNPDLLFEFLDILFWYIHHGVRILRLDAVAFCWKEIGTDCLHRPQTHELVKLLRDVCEMVAPEVILLTETNVPHVDNISYFGEGDEAHMVYNFSLAPLVLDALMQGDSQYLTQWAASLDAAPSGCAFLNFTASHDGIGVGPARGILPPARIEALTAAVKARGGAVSYKRNSDGSETAYELNITYASALSDGADDALAWERFLCSQLIALGLRGIPAVYIHSLFGSANDHDGVAETGRARSINRARLSAAALNGLLADAEHPQTAHFRKLTQALRRRGAQPAFHPDAAQRVHSIGAGWFAFERRSVDGEQRILCLHNLTAQEQKLDTRQLSALGLDGKATDLLNGKSLSIGKRALKVRPYQSLWLS